MNKNLLLILAALVLLVLFPGLTQAVAAVVVWLSTQPILVGFILGLIALPHLGRATKTTHPVDH